jgi:hypothetical protein
VGMMPLTEARCELLRPWRCPGPMAGDPRENLETLKTPHINPTISAVEMIKRTS